MRRLIYIILLIPFFFSSCYKDEGNYDYNRFPELLIDSIDEDYGTLILFEDSLNIEPVISFGKEDHSSFDMSWYLQTNDSLELVSKGKDLHILLNNSGKLTFLFEAIHKETKLFTHKKTSVTVSSLMERGIYILKETQDGNTDLDAHLRLDVDKYNLMPDLITQKLGAPLPGKPVDLDYWDWLVHDPAGEEDVFSRVIRPVSEKDIAIFRMSDFAHLGGMPELFYDLNEDEFPILACKSMQENSLVITKDGRARSMPNNRVSRFQMELNGDYDLYPKTLSPERGGNFVVFDKHTSSFMLASATSTALNKFSDYDLMGRPKPVNNLNVDVHFMGRGRGNIGIVPGNLGIGYAIVSDRQYPDSMYLYQFTLNWIAKNMGSSISPLETVDALPMHLNMRRSNLLCMHEYEKSILYAVDNRVFTYNILNKRENLLINQSDYPEGKIPDEITYLKYIQCNYDNKDFNFEWLFVGGYKDGHYMLFAFEVYAGELVGTPKVWEGEGKIKDIRYTTLNKLIDKYYVWQ